MPLHKPLDGNTLDSKVGEDNWAESIYTGDADVILCRASEVHSTHLNHPQKVFYQVYVPELIQKLFDLP